MKRILLPSLLFSVVCLAAFPQDRGTASRELTTRTGHKVKPAASKGAAFPPGVTLPRCPSAPLSLEFVWRLLSGTAYWRFRAI